MYIDSMIYIIPKTKGRLTHVLRLTHSTGLELGSVPPPLSAFRGSHLAFFPSLPKKRTLKWQTAKHFCVYCHQVQFIVAQFLATFFFAPGFYFIYSLSSVDNRSLWRGGWSFLGFLTGIFNQRL